jgi:hypothetical protein
MLLNLDKVANPAKRLKRNRGSFCFPKERSDSGLRAKKSAAEHQSETGAERCLRDEKILIQSLFQAYAPGRIEVCPFIIIHQEATQIVKPDEENQRDEEEREQ